MNQDPLQVLLKFERELRAIIRMRPLSFAAANKSKRFLPYINSIVWTCENESRVHVEAVSTTSSINERSPYIIWLNQKLVPFLLKKNAKKSEFIDSTQLPETLSDWQEYLTNNLLYLPILDFKNETIIGGMLFVYQEFRPNLNCPRI